ncbi:MAG: hypothetical protein COB78_06670 [Hyphomicrobiales bacterium]|nr:MAG: hypothetical protein COB78_06670 [Hyphomicrobiales bacterium]
MQIVAAGKWARKRIVFACCAVLFSLFALGGNHAHAVARDAEVIRGFNLTVFGAEYAPFGFQSRYIRKFRKPVRFYIHNMSRKNRTKAVRRFILGLNRNIKGLKTRIVSSPAKANFIIHVVDRKDYVNIVRTKIYRRPNAATPGKCLVRSVFSRRGIKRSDAAIVSDGGEKLFKRCLIEEILQGLGPLNEHRSLWRSVFNDASKQVSFTRFDRLILNMLYDPRIKNGASLEKVQKILPEVLRSAKRRVR